MITTQKFEKLHGEEVNRAALEQLIAEAKQENNIVIVYRLSQILLQYPKEQTFEIEVKKYKQTATALNALVPIIDYKEALTDNGELREGYQFKNGKVVKSASTSVKQSIDAEVLAGIEYIQEEDSDLEGGLGKAVSPKEIYKMVTDKIIKQIEDFKEDTWEKTWQASGYKFAYNFITKKPYQSINQMVLGNFYNGQLLENPYFLTFKQIEKLKGRIRKGVKSEQVTYYTILYSFEQHKPKLKFATYDVKKFTNWVQKNKSKINRLTMPYRSNNGVPVTRDISDFINDCKVPILKYYNVFNGADVEGIDFDLENFKGVGYIKAPENNNEPIASCEAIIENYPNPKPKLVIGNSDRAYYHRANDLVNMPEIRLFKNAQAYYTTLFHEYIHSTGSPDRLKRVKGKKFGDKDYSFEELIAEIGASFLCANGGILHYTLRNGAAYIKGWHQVLIKHLKEDNKFIFKAATKAQKAAEFILQPDENGEPKFLKNLTSKIEKPQSKTDLPKTIETYEEWKTLRTPFYSENVSLAYYQEFFNLTINSKELLMKNINKTYTLAQLKRMFYVNRDRKHEYVDTFFSNMLHFFVNGGVTVSWTQTFEEVIKGIVEKADQEYVDKLVAKLQKEEEEHKTRKEKLKKSISNPETLDEYLTFIKLKGIKELNEKQLEQFDWLYTEDYQRRADQKLVEAAEKRVKDVNTNDIKAVKLEYNKSTHTKTGDDIFVVSIVERVEREIYNQLNQLAKSKGGYYSSYSRGGAIAGFIFKTKEKAESFMNVVENGEKPIDPKTVLKEREERRKKTFERLIKQAEQRIETAYEEINTPRLTNTHRRARMVDSVISSMEDIISRNKILIEVIRNVNIKKAIALKNISSFVEIAQMYLVTKSATYDWMREQKNGKYFRENSPNSAEVLKNEVSFFDIAHFLEKPSLWVGKTKIEEVLKIAINKKGYKLKTKRLIKRLIQDKKYDHIMHIPFGYIDLYGELLEAAKSSYDYSDNLIEDYKKFKRLIKILGGANNSVILRQAAREIYQAFKEVDVYDAEGKKKKELDKLYSKVRFYKIPGFFPTPDKLTYDILKNLKVYSDDSILEPSAGIGSMADIIKEQNPDNELTLIEFQQSLADILEKKGYENVLRQNFLDYKEKHDIIVMNPPFEKDQDIDHVMHAYSLLKDGGRIVAIMANNKTNSSINKRKEFEEFVNDNGWKVDNPKGSFVSSFHPTGVNTITVYLEKQATEETKPIKENKPKQLQLALNGAVPNINHFEEVNLTPEIEVEYHTSESSENKTSVLLANENTKAKKDVKVSEIKNKTVLSSADILNMNFDTLNFTGEWKELMQDPAKNMKLAIWGKPKNGKTAGATKFANYLTNFGSILYNFADQGVNKSTKDLWKLSGLDKKENAFLTDTRDIKELDNLCASGNYDFVFIDMINTYIHRTGIKYFEFEDQFIKKYPNISFILIFEVTKTGNFKGDQGWTHLPDALITVDSFVMHNQGRYGVGEYVVWKEGLKKVNPKKYKEIYTDEEQQESTIETTHEIVM